MAWHGHIGTRQCNYGNVAAKWKMGLLPLWSRLCLMKAICLISRAFIEVAALEIWSKRNGGERKLTVCLLLCALDSETSLDWSLTRLLSQQMAGPDWSEWLELVTIPQHNKSIDSRHLRRHNKKHVKPIAFIPPSSAPWGNKKREPQYKGPQDVIFFEQN